MSIYDYDLLVIGGGGSGGFTAATTAMKYGAKVAMVESGRLGGLCILAGCMPSKAILHDAARLHGLGLDGRKFAPEVIARKRRVVEHLAGNRQHAVAAKAAQGLEVIRGQARFTGPHTVQVEGREYSAARLVIATGSAWTAPPIPGLADAGYLTSDSLLELEELPKSLIVLGGGTLALELAQYAQRMGVATTVLQRSGHLMSREDARVGDALQKALGNEGMEIRTSIDLARVQSGPEGKTVWFGHDGEEQSITAQEILVALGRRANTSGLGLEAAGVELGPKGQVKVDARMRTSAKHIFAAGDVTGVMMVVNLAVLQGEVAGYNVANDISRKIDDRVLPRAVFTDPEFARVGLNAGQCRERGIDFAEAEFELGDMGAAKTYPQEIIGFVALRAERPSGLIIGAEVVAPSASSMIHDLAVAMKLGGTAQDIADIPYIHPCLAEATNLAAYRLAKKLKR